MVSDTVIESPNEAAPATGVVSHVDLDFREGQSGGRRDMPCGPGRIYSNFSHELVGQHFI